MDMLRQGTPNRTIYYYLPPRLQNNQDKPNVDPTGNLRRWEDIILDALYEWVIEEGLVDWISPAEWLADTENASGKITEHYPLHLFFHVDGTVFAVWNPSDGSLNKAHWNSKHGVCAWQFYVVVTQTGRIVKVSTVMHDKTHFEKDKVSDDLEVSACAPLFAIVAVLATHPTLLNGF